MKWTDSLVDNIQRASSAADCDEQKIKLLGEFQQGRSLGDLTPLLLSANENAVEVAVWIASELGAIGKPLLPDVVPLLGHPQRAVRFFALDCILEWTSSANGAAIVRAVLLAEDRDAAVRWKALRFLSSASGEQLVAAQAQLMSTGIHARHASALSWLLGDDAQNPEKVLTQLRDPDSLFRKYGVVAAARMSRSNRQPLADASTSSDADVQQFAIDTLSLV